MTTALPLPAAFGRAGDQGDAMAMSEEEFARIAALAERVAGLCIPASKRTMVQSRLVRRLRATGRRGFKEYLELFDGPDASLELPHLISALTTNVSHFFREDHHFRTLRTEVLPDLMSRARRGERVRIWSAGCSSGQEPYSIAMCLLECDPQAPGYDVRILATDIDHSILGRAMSGVYTETQVQGLPQSALKTWTKPTASGTEWRIEDAVRQLVSFRHLNLIEPWPMRGRFDVVFCRNVVIYFSEATQRALWPRFSELIRPGGWFFLGHSERIHDPATTGFVSAGVTSYRRLGASEIQEAK